MSNVIDFHSEADKRHVPDAVATESLSDDRYQYVLELEHEILELQHQVCSLHRDLERAKGNM